MAQTASPGVLHKKRRGLRLADRARIGRAAPVSRGRGAGGPRRGRFRPSCSRHARPSTARRFGLARQRLSRLAERWTNDGEVLFLLGNSEFELGKRDDALAAWARVPASSPYFGKAVIARASRLGRKRPLFTGRIAISSKHLADPRPSGRYELELALTRVYRYQGRFHDVRPLDSSLVVPRSAAGGSFSRNSGALIWLPDRSSS